MGIKIHLKKCPAYKIITNINVNNINKYIHALNQLF